VPSGRRVSYASLIRFTLAGLKRPTKGNELTASDLVHAHHSSSVMSETTQCSSIIHFINLKSTRENSTNTRAEVCAIYLGRRRN